MLNRTWRNITDKIEEEIAKQISNKLTFASLSKTCETCGCLIGVGGETEGKSEIREAPISPYSMSIWLGGYQRKQKHIYTPYYCKVHVPEGIKCEKA